MKGKSAFLVSLALVGAGCAPQAPSPVVQSRPQVEAPPASKPTEEPKPISPAPMPVVAIVEPYLVAIAAPTYPAPPTLRGSIIPSPPPPSGPLLPPPPTQTAPVAPSPSPAPPPQPRASVPKPTAPTSVPPAIVRLFEEERARSVDDARDRLATATTRANQTAADAKRLWGFVKDGFVAQKQAENADAAAKAAAVEQAGAQKALDDAQRRQRDARRDLEAAMRRVTEQLSEAQLVRLVTTPKAYQIVPGAYRVSVLGSTPVSISLQGGTVSRRLMTNPGEAGAWLVRAVDPSKLRVGVGKQPATVIVRTLPAPDDASKV